MVGNGSVFVCQRLGIVDSLFLSCKATYRLIFFSKQLIGMFNDNQKLQA